MIDFNKNLVKIFYQILFFQSQFVLKCLQILNIRLKLKIKELQCVFFDLIQFDVVLSLFFQFLDVIDYRVFEFQVEFLFQMKVVIFETDLLYDLSCVAFVIDQKYCKSNEYYCANEMGPNIHHFIMAPKNAL